GAKLTTMTQATAYQGIQEETHLKYKRATLMNLDMTRHAIRDISTSLETDDKIWISCRHPDISKKIQLFLYKSIHNTHRIGNFWSNIPNYEQRATCHQCNEDTESIEHILIECSNPIKNATWDLAKKTWPTDHNPWPRITRHGGSNYGMWRNHPRTTTNTKQTNKETQR
ncbi:hypothetical protein EDB19DRAFT_1643159, partial [Suillus lakei]